MSGADEIGKMDLTTVETQESNYGFVAYGVAGRERLQSLGPIPQACLACGKDLADSEGGLDCFLSQTWTVGQPVPSSRMEFSCPHCGHGYLIVDGSSDAAPAP